MHYFTTKNLKDPIQSQMILLLNELKKIKCPKELISSCLMVCLSWDLCSLGVFL